MVVMEARVETVQIMIPEPVARAATVVMEPQGSMERQMVGKVKMAWMAQLAAMVAQARPAGQAAKVEMPVRAAQAAKYLSMPTKM